MLVIERHIGEELLLTGPNGLVIRIKLTRIGGGKAELGITAPRDIIVGFAQ